jgi:hypothetical protein
MWKWYFNLFNRTRNYNCHSWWHMLTEYKFLTPVNTSAAVLWVVMPCSLVSGHHFRRRASPPSSGFKWLQTQRQGDTPSSETLLDTYKTTRCHNPDHNQHTTAHDKAATTTTTNNNKNNNNVSTVMSIKPFPVAVQIIVNLMCLL